MREELEAIKKIRVENNDLWMAILDIALRHAPAETKEVLGGIFMNDTLVTKYMREIFNENSEPEDRA